jgi:hypothetical protein
MESLLAVRQSLSAPTCAKPTVIFFRCPPPRAGPVVAPPVAAAVLVVGFARAHPQPARAQQGERDRSRPNASCSPSCVSFLARAWWLWPRGTSQPDAATISSDGAGSAGESMLGIEESQVASRREAREVHAQFEQVVVAPHARLAAGTLRARGTWSQLLGGGRSSAAAGPGDRARWRVRSSRQPPRDGETGLRVRVPASPRYGPGATSPAPRSRWRRNRRVRGR